MIDINSETKKQLLEEVKQLRQKVAEFEARQQHQNEIELTIQTSQSFREAGLA